jgi:hypothetical protein
MAKDKIGIAFARFSQLDPSRTRKAGGTGLGLAIVAKSVELMGGEISVESERGRGTRFLLRLPFEPGSEEIISKRDSEPKGSGDVVLAGFDEEGFLDAALALSRLGYSALRADTLEDAAAQAKGFVLADESLFEDVDEALGASLPSRLVIAARLGGDIRSRLGGGEIAFASLPLRSAALRHAFASLAAASDLERGASERDGFHSVVSPEGKGILERLASALERAAVEAAFGDAEREAKIAQGSLSEAGDMDGSRLAFVALLSARKGDAAAIKAAAARMREIASRGGR